MQSYNTLSLSQHIFMCPNNIIISTVTETQYTFTNYCFQDKHSSLWNTDLKHVPSSNPTEDSLNIVIFIDINMSWVISHPYFQMSLGLSQENLILPFYSKSSTVSRQTSRR